MDWKSKFDKAEIEGDLNEARGGLKELWADNAVFRVAVIVGAAFGLMVLLVLAAT
jgi:hypothetical protein